MRSAQSGALNRHGWGLDRQTPRSIRDLDRQKVHGVPSEEAREVDGEGERVDDVGRAPRLQLGHHGGVGAGQALGGLRGAGTAHRDRDARVRTRALRTVGFGGMRRAKCAARKDEEQRGGGG